MGAMAALTRRLFAQTSISDPEFPGFLKNFLRRIDYSPVAPVEIWIPAPAPQIERNQVGQAGWRETAFAVGAVLIDYLQTFAIPLFRLLDILIA